MDGWMDVWMNGWMDGWMDGRTDGRTDGWMDGWMEGLMSGWMGYFRDSGEQCTRDKRAHTGTHTHAYIVISYIHKRPGNT